ncbi:unnamed protein product [Symbiodinium microadriaticum]|nr:unnamed protein product [Symbiodinium sp. KB8]CAE7244578.1 unnamed protein product [Symbiodinium microadriaticum]
MPRPRPEDPEEEIEVAAGDEGNPEEDGKVKVYWTNHAVAEAWEKSPILRKRGRETKQLTRWPAAKTKGIPSMQAIHLNGDALLILAKKWCPLVPMAKTPTIEVLTTEVQKWREEMGLQEDSVIEYLDIWGLRRMFSLAIRRRSSSRRSRDNVVEQFFDVLLRHWGHTKQYLAKLARQEAQQEAVDEEADELWSDGYFELSDSEDASWCVKFRDAGGSSESLPSQLEDSLGSNEVPEEIPEPEQAESTMHGVSSDSLGSDKVEEEILGPPDVESTKHDASIDVDGVDMDADELAIEEALLLKQLATLQGSLQASAPVCPDNMETQIEGLQTPEALAAFSRSKISLDGLENVLPGKHFLPAVEPSSTSATSEPDSAYVTPSPKCLLPDLVDVATPLKTEAPVVQATSTTDAPKNDPSVEASEAVDTEQAMNYQGFASRKDQTGIKRRNKELAEAKAKPGGRGRGGRGRGGKGQASLTMEPHDDDGASKDMACTGRGRAGGGGRGKGETSGPVEEGDHEDDWGDDEGAKPKKKKQKRADPKASKDDQNGECTNKKAKMDGTKAAKEKPTKRLKVVKATAESEAAAACDDDEQEWHDGEATCYYDMDDPSWWPAEQQWDAAAWEAWWDDWGCALYGAQETEEAMAEAVPEPNHEEEEPAAEPEPSFARRPPPKTQVPYDRWSAVRDAFKTYVSPHILYSCKYQDPFWKVCMAKFADRKDELNKGLVDFSTIANSAIVDIMPRKGIRKGQAFLARLAVAMVLQGTWSQVVCFFGTCCSSFVNINSGTQYPLNFAKKLVSMLPTMQDHGETSLPDLLSVLDEGMWPEAEMSTVVTYLRHVFCDTYHQFWHWMTVEVELPQVPLAKATSDGQEAKSAQFVAPPAPAWAHEIHESYTESELEIQGEYASEETMVEKRIDAVKSYCSHNPGRFMRRDTYEQDKVLYWCEKAVKATHKEGERWIRRSQSTFEADGVAGPSEPSVCPIVDPSGGAALTAADLGSIDDKGAIDDKDACTRRSQKLLEVKTLYDEIDRMQAKIEQVYADIDTLHDAITTMHSDGLIDGFSTELLACMLFLQMLCNTRSELNPFRAAWMQGGGCSSQQVAGRQEAAPRLPPRSVDGFMHTFYKNRSASWQLQGCASSWVGNPCEDPAIFTCTQVCIIRPMTWFRTIIPKKSTPSPVPKSPAKGKGKRALAVTQTPKAKAKPDAEQAKKPRKS